MGWILLMLNDAGEPVSWLTGETIEELLTRFRVSWQDPTLAPLEHTIRATARRASAINRWDLGSPMPERHLWLLHT